MSVYRGTRFDPCGLPQHVPLHVSKRMTGKNLRIFGTLFHTCCKEFHTGDYR